MKLSYLIFAISLQFTGFILSQSSFTCADDWPQINGPSRNGKAPQEKLLTTWPKNGLTKVWTHTVGQGYSGPVVVDDKLIIFHRPGRQYLVEALNAKTGKVIWNRELPSEYSAGGPDSDTGPKAVPLVYDGHVYLFGTGGNLFCLRLDDGKVVWKKNVLDIYSSPSGYFGSGSSPIVINEKLLLNVGGKNAGVVAFDLKNGKEIWKAFDGRASYSSPIAFEANGKSLAFFVTRLHALVVDPDSGQVLGKIRFGRSGATVNGAMPVLIGKRIFLNAAYYVGGKVVEWSKGQLNAQPQTPNDQFASQYSTPVAVGLNLYGTAGREDFDNGSFRCVEISENGTMKLKWKREGIPIGHSILVGKQILTLDSKGGFHVIEANPERFNQIFTTQLFNSKSRAMPAIANGLFYARSNATRGKGELICLEVGQRD